MQVGGHQIVLYRNSISLGRDLTKCFMSNSQPIRVEAAAVFLPVNQEAENLRFKCRKAFIRRPSPFWPVLLRIFKYPVHNRTYMYTAWASEYLSFFSFFLIRWPFAGLLSPVCYTHLFNPALRFQDYIWGLQKEKSLKAEVQGEWVIGERDGTRHVIALEWSRNRKRGLAERDEQMLRLCVIRWQEASKGAQLRAN